MIVWEKSAGEREGWEIEQKIIDMNHDQYTLFLKFIMLHLQFVSEKKLNAGKQRF